MTSESILQHGASNTLPGNALILSEPIGIVAHIASTTATVTPRTALEKPVLVGELLAIHAGSALILGEVSLVESHGHGVEIATTLLATIDATTLSITPGINVVPSNGSGVYRPNDTVVQAYLEGRTSLFDDLIATINLTIGASPLCPTKELSFAPEKLLGRHCAVVGTSGSGKSWSVARLMEQCAQHKGKVILIDPSGEYETLSGPVRHLHVGAPALTRGTSDEVVLPYYELTEADLVAILRPTNPTQITKLRAAIRSLKLLQFDPRLGIDGTLPKAHRLKTPYECILADYRLEVGTPENRFNITNLAMQIGLECVDPIRSQTESDYWGGMNTTDHNACVPLIATLEDLLQSVELQCILSPSQGESLLSAVEDFLADPSLAVLRVSCEYLPSTNRVREIFANALARHLLGLARAGRFRSAPLILAVDEAHQMLPKTSSHLSTDYPLEAFNVIAKEGRKYGLALCIATQRPRDIPDDVLSQVGTFIVHRLVSDADRDAIERASGGVNRALNERLPLLAPGEAFLMGIDFQNPLRLRMSKPMSAPVSNGPDFQTSWGIDTVQ